MVILLQNHAHGEDGISVPAVGPNSDQLSLNAGGIVLEELSCNRTRVRMAITFDAGLENMPEWILDLIAATVFQTSMQRWQMAAQKLEQQNEFSFLKDIGSDQFSSLYSWISERCQSTAPNEKV